MSMLNRNEFKRNKHFDENMNEQYCILKALNLIKVNLRHKLNRFKLLKHNSKKYWWAWISTAHGPASHYG